MKDCYNCPFKSAIPGNTHIACRHPIFIKEPALAFKLHISVMIGKDSYVKEVLGLKFDRYGVDSGWCSFPLDYDPVWIQGDCKLLKAYNNSINFVNVGTIGHVDHQKSTLNIKDII